LDIGSFFFSRSIIRARVLWNCFFTSNADMFQREIMGLTCPAGPYESLSYSIKRKLCR
jgi:hypothetical protein